MTTNHQVKTGCHYWRLLFFLDNYVRFVNINHSSKLLATSLAFQLLTIPIKTGTLKTT